MLIFTKLQRPRVRPDTILRPSLIERLNRGLDRKLTLISAQAGAGKTTLMAQWLEQCPQPSAWLALDPHDNDLMLFAGYLCAAIGTIYPDACGEAATLLNASRVPPQRVLLTALVNQLSLFFGDDRLPGNSAEASPRLIIALDDFHHITDPTIQQFVTDLLTYLPRNLHLALTSRTDPPLPLAALRARKEMSELRTGDLRFTIGEAQTLLEGTVGRDLDEATVKFLEGATEGWATGLRLAGLSLRHATDEQRFAAQFLDKSSAVIVDYLAGEVLAQQSPAVREFLLATSILDRFCASLADALLTQTAMGAQAHVILDEIGRANLFLVSLDAEGHWFRYHHLFRDLLQYLLRRERTPAEINALHLRASRWFDEQDLTGEALDHAFAAGATEQAVQIVAGQRYDLMNRAQWQQLERYLRRFPPDVVDQQPQLLMLKSWLLYHHGHNDQLPAALNQLEILLAQTDPSGPSARHLAGEINALYSLLAYYDADPARTMAAAEFAIAHTPPELWIVRILARLFLGAAHQIRGETDKALDSILQGLQDESLDTHPFKATTLLSACSLLWITNDLDRSIQTARRCVEFCDYANAAEIEGYAHYHLGRAYYYQNDVAAAADHFARVFGRPYLNYGDAYANAAFGLALTHHVQGRPDTARAVLQEADAFMTERGNTTMLAVVRAAQAELALRQGDVAAADQWASHFATVPPLAPMPHLCRPHLTLAKVWLAHDTPAGRRRTAALLDQIQAHSEATHHTSVLIEVLALQALRHAAQRHDTAALQQLEQALTIARPGGNVRIFADLGAPMAALLHELLRQGIAPRYVAHILAAQSSPATVGHRAASDNGNSHALGLAESLTPRELDVLVLLAERLTNREIAAKLVLAPGTVKTHTLNLYAKLDVHSRRQAVARAQELGLV